MGQYKVAQDVEAQDKIIGFLTVRQFIFAVIGVMYGFLAFTIFRHLPVFFVVFGLPPTFLFLLLGLYQRKDQPFEALFLALVNYWAKPRKRLWQKEPIAEVFKIEPPKPIPQAIQLDPAQVRGQLEHLSHIVDTRGWSAKEATVQEPTAQPVIALEERIAAPSAPAPVEAQPTEVNLADDILDFENNPTAQNVNVLIENSVKNIRQEALTKVEQYRAQPATSPKASSSAVAPPPPDGILKVANQTGDLSVSQVAKMAQKAGQLPEGESVSVRDGQS